MCIINLQKNRLIHTRFIGISNCPRHASNSTGRIGMIENRNIRKPVLIMLAILIAVQILAIAITPPINEVFENGNASRPLGNNSSPGISFDILIFLFVILVYTVIMIQAVRLKNARLLNGLILLSMGICICYVLIINLMEMAGADMAPLIALIATVAILLLMKTYPKWYIIDLICILVCAGIGTIYGISMNIPTAIFFLIVMAVYDIISVYKTRHMELLAQAMVSIKAPLIFVLPGLSNRSAGKNNNSAQSGEGKMNYPLFLGLGDAIIPTMLVVSAYNPTSLYYMGPIPALGAMIGTYVGFIILMTALSDRMHAGLPFLNGGAIIGYLLAYIISGSGFSLLR
ncbi:MAG: presenilin family intramembrane aspartyl protease [Methanothrix sp.]|nr:presenilin family intramembrane aspartyl protease [Methanothrix sp.]